jgi:effector-binding domain-containing protein
MIEPIRMIRTIPQLTALIPIKIPSQEVRKIMGPGLAELKAAVAAQGIAIVGPWFTHHLRNPGEIFDFEIGLPVAAPVAPVGRVRAGQWPAMDVAQTIYHGGYESLGSAWGQFMEAVKAAGCAAADGLYESYVVGPEASADPASWRTQLNKPLIEPQRQL